MNYYKVTCKCGHVKKDKYIEIDFAIKAESGKEAAKIAREIPRVKHDKKYAILKTTKITEEEYLKIIESNHQDPYLQCENIQEQNLLDLSDRIKYEPEPIDYKYKNKNEAKMVKGKLVRNYKKYYMLNLLYA